MVTREIRGQWLVHGEEVTFDRLKKE